MLRIIESILWAVASVFIIFTSIYMTIKLKFVQLDFKNIFKNVFYKTTNNISLLQSLMMVLGGRIGVGCIAGTAIAIYLGGIGSVFWMTIFGFLSAAITFSEVVLGCKYNKEDGEVYIGGPTYYLEHGLKSKKLSKIYAFIMIISIIFGTLTIQSNTISTIILDSFNISRFNLVLLISLASFFIIKGGLKKISKVINVLVPIMILVYLVFTMHILFENINIIPKLTQEIISQAFNYKAFGFGLLSTMIIGIQRGIFSNESGLGTGAIAASVLKLEYPARQGYVQMLSTYITTFFICLVTAYVVIISLDSNQNIKNGIEMVQNVFNIYFGQLGNIVLIIVVSMFAFSTVLSGYYDCETNFKKLFNINTKFLVIISIIAIFIGAYINSLYIWKIINIMSAILAIINIYAIFSLKNEINKELKLYKNMC